MARKIKNPEAYAARKEYERTAKSSPPGEGSRFKALARAIRARGGVKDPEAVAAAIGRKKYGKKRFQEMAAAGRRKG